MRNFIVKINGKTYNAEVEEVTGGAAPAAAPVSAPAVQAAPAQVAAPVQSPVAAPAAPIPAGGNTTTAPIPGTVLKINVAPGASVNKGDVIIILEAMKMENEIMAGVSGTVSSINVQTGSAVSTGDVLFVIS